MNPDNLRNWQLDGYHAELGDSDKDLLPIHFSASDLIQAAAAAWMGKDVRAVDKALEQLLASGAISLEDAEAIKASLKPETDDLAAL